MRRGRPLAAALAYHLHRRWASSWCLVGATAVATGLLALRDPTAPVGPGAPVTAAVVVAAFLHMAGAVGGEARAGRAALWCMVAGGRLRWLVRDLGLRLLALSLVGLGVVLAGSGAVALVSGPARGARFLSGAGPFLALLALTLAAVAYGWSALAPRLDGLLAALYVFPLSMIGTALVAAAGAERPALLWLAFPVDALLAFAPGSPLPRALVPGPPAGLHLALFTAAWLALGLVVGWWRLAAFAER